MPSTGGAGLLGVAPLGVVEGGEQTGEHRPGACVLGHPDDDGDVGARGERIEHGHLLRRGMPARIGGLCAA
jgi:hypothetical protein